MLSSVWNGASQDVLDVLGFEKKEDCLEQRKSTPDGFLCGKADGNKTEKDNKTKGIVSEPTPEPMGPPPKNVDATDGALMSIIIGVGVTLVFFLGLYCTLQLGRRRSQQQEIGRLGRT
eukprot:symbB.v1.2.036907.t1/scaffold5321.1/size28434/2